MKRNARIERRIEARDHAIATILGHPDVTVACRIRNVSRSGMCITVDDPMPFGRVVKVEWSDHFLVGRIQRVAPAGTEFRVGLELLYCSKWNDLMSTVLASV
jgi:hypothetical protein